MLDKHTKDILYKNYQITDKTNVFIVYDEDCSLSKQLYKSFTNNLTKFDSKLFSLDDVEEIKEKINSLNKSDLVILIQSLSFRVSNYRWRKELYDKDLKVIEFSHLSRVEENEEQHFINSLVYDKKHYKKVCDKLIPLIDNSKEIKILSGNDLELKYSGQMDKCIINIADFEGKENWGTRFPVGEIITESLDLKDLNGDAEFYAYPNEEFKTTFCKPFKGTIKDGFLISHEGDKEFNELYEKIKTENDKGLVYVRELGMGLNRGIKRFDLISEAQAYERQEGLHFSLGMKHGMYQKKLWKEYGKDFYQRYHIDVYVNVNEIYIDDILVYTKDEGYLV